MKKFGSLALAALLVTALGTSAFAANSYEASKGTAKVDGKKDNIYVCDPAIIDIAESTNEKAAEGATGKAWTAYDEENLYVYIEVTDAVLTPADKVTTTGCEFDSVEVYVNFAGKEGATTEITAGQFTYGPNFPGMGGYGKYNSDKKDVVEKAFTVTDYGYTVEMAIPFGDFEADEGVTFTGGFGINDDMKGEGARTAHNFDGANMGSAWSTADSNWATITLTDKKYTPKAESAAQTADMGIVAAVASLAASGAAFISLKKRK